MPGKELITAIFFGLRNLPVKKNFVMAGDGGNKLITLP
tara:strand:+ start:31944 stop:32057 length:114 start_codon:yes stop_codon:yes gene_type:complete